MQTLTWYMALNDVREIVFHAAKHDATADEEQPGRDSRIEESQPRNTPAQRGGAKCNDERREWIQGQPIAQTARAAGRGIHVDRRCGKHPDLQQERDDIADV